MNIQQEIRKIFNFLQQKETGHDEYGNNGYIILSGSKYFVGKMSYDEWYLEPYYKDRKETDKFTDKTLWEKYDLIKILQLFSDNNLLELKVK